MFNACTDLQQICVNVSIKLFLFFYVSDTQSAGHEFYTKSSLCVHFYHFNCLYVFFFISTVI